jgi:hypothetical protein
MSAGKTDKVAQGYRTKQWENSRLWSNMKASKEAQEEVKKQGIEIVGIEIVEEKKRK